MPCGVELHGAIRSLLKIFMPCCTPPMAAAAHAGVHHHTLLPLSMEPRPKRPLLAAIADADQYMRRSRVHPVDAELKAPPVEKPPVLKKRPSMLLIPRDCPVLPPGFCAGAGGGEEEKRRDVEVDGDGVWVVGRQGARHAMEDGYGVSTLNHGGSTVAFFGVFDGHGGRAAVEFVEERLANNIAAALAAKKMTSEEEEEDAVAGDCGRRRLEEAVRTGYLTTDDEFSAQGERGGACAATAVVAGGSLHVANVGDCRVVMSRGGAACELTTDHTAGREDERKRIEDSGGYVSCGGGGVWRVLDSLAVSRSFGNCDLKEWVIAEPGTATVELDGECEFLVIASDGLWNKVSSQEAVDAVKKRRRSGACDVIESCRELAATAKKRGSRDDITVMVVDLQRFVNVDGRDRRR